MGFAIPRNGVSGFVIRKNNSYLLAIRTPRSLKVLADLRIRKSAAPVAPDCKSGAAFVCCGCAVTLRGICNPTQWSIRICNSKKQFLFAGHTHTTVIESPCGLADSEIRSSCCTGLQIRRSVCLRNDPSVSTLRGICNPTQWSIRICNPKKQFLFAGHTHTTVIESPCGLADSEIRSSCCTGLQIRRSVCLRNNPSVFHAAANRIDGYQKILTAEKEDILTWQSKISYLPI